VLLPVFRVMLGQPKRLWEAQLRMLVPISLMSTFFFKCVPVLCATHRLSALAASARVL
jgi:hypothetical protein